MTERNRPPQGSSARIPSRCDLNRLRSFLMTNLEEIENASPYFFGTLKIEVSFRQGEIETVAVERRQTFKS